MKLQSVKDARVVVANRIYIEDKSSLNSEFNEGSQKILKATADKIDFASTTAAEVINNWIRNATRNRITGIVDRGVRKKV
jgi:serine protease inhibitor